MGGALCALRLHGPPTKQGHEASRLSITMARSGVATFLLLLLLVVASMAAAARGALQVGFYGGKCGANNVEAIIQGVVRNRFRRDPTLPAALLRMQFHDCFVRGCDASILLDGSSSEKTAPPNQSVRGYEVIDQVKAQLEAVCPGVVSCADIIAAATRDAVALGGGPRYAVRMGRRDGRVSLSQDVDLPGPSISVAQSIKAFKTKGLNTTDMVLLLGGHTVGVTHCSFVAPRLYNFQGSGKPDPAMDRALLAKLRRWCPQNGTAPGPAVDLDQNPRSANAVDNSFYQQIAAGRGVLQIDQSLALHRATRLAVASLANAPAATFRARFAPAMVKLGAVQVLTGRQGEIRNSCRSVNSV